MESFRIKSPEELENQVDGVSKTLGSEIAPPSTKKEIFDLSIEDIKTKYPARYEMYLDVLRKQKSKAEIDEKEKKRCSIGWNH